MLGLLAGVMADQGVARVRYTGPYPTESLFTALLESFRYDPAARSPLEVFMAGEPLDWTPAPPERHHVAGDVCVQLRDGIDKVVLGRAAFYRPDWQGVIRREPRTVRAEGDRVVCSLWALGQALEDRLVLDRSGEVLEAPAPPADARPPAPMLPVWTSALADLIARESPPILAEPIAAALRAVELEWGPVPGDVLRVEPSHLRVSRRIRDPGSDGCARRRSRAPARNGPSSSLWRWRGSSPPRSGSAPRTPWPPCPTPSNAAAGTPPRRRRHPPCPNRPAASSP